MLHGVVQLDTVEVRGLGRALGVMVGRGGWCWRGVELRLGRDWRRCSLVGLGRLEHHQHSAARVLPGWCGGEGRHEVTLGGPQLDCDAFLLDGRGQGVGHHGGGAAPSVAVEGGVEHRPEPLPRRPVPVAGWAASRELAHGER